MTRPAHWRVHTASLLKQVLDNPGTTVLRQPLSIFSNLLAQVAKRAIELDDPALNILMMRLTLYDQADPVKYDWEGIEEAYVAQRERLTKSQSTL